MYATLYNLYKYLRGAIYCVLFLSSIFGGYILFFCPFFPLILISNRLYRKWTDFLLGFWQIHAAGLMEVAMRSKVYVSGDKILANERSLLVMNHRTRTDWNYIWTAASHCMDSPGRFAHPIKFVLKDEIRHLPGIGWVMQLAAYLFIKRDWGIDKQRLGHMYEYFAECRYNFSLMIFPEGTDLTPANKAKSDLYAQKNNLPCYEYVLHPKTTGFVFTCKKLMDEDALDCFYDVTVAYPDLVPQEEMSLLRGEFPREVNIHFQRYDLKDLPRSEGDLKLFLEALWLEKEVMLGEFYKRKARDVLARGKPFHGENLRDRCVAMSFWLLVTPVAIGLFVTNNALFNIVILHTGFIFIINYFFGGWQNFEIGLYRLKKKLGLTLLY